MYKKERLAEALHSFVANELRSLHDQRFSLVTITEVRPGKDYKSAKIFWTMPADAERGEAFPSDKNQRVMSEALDGVVSLLRRRIAEELSLRFVPELVFAYDSSAERGSKIDELLKKAGY
jgi:ribosome-binding factor A